MSDAIPDRWKRCSLSSLGGYENGFAFNELHWSEHGLPIVRIAQITGSQGIVDRYPGRLPDTFRIDNGDLIFSWSGTLAVVRWTGGPAWLNQHLFKVEPASGIDRSLLFHLLQASVAEMNKRTHGSTMKHIKRGELRDFFVNLPVDVNEQRMLAKILDTLDTAIHETEAIIAKLKAVKQGLLHDLLTRGIDANGELRPPQAEAAHLYKPSPLGWIPTDWRIQAGSEVCKEIVVGIVVRPTQYYRLEGIPVLRSANIRENRLSLNDLVFMSLKNHRALSKSAVRPGDVLTVRTGYPGTSCVVPETVEEANCVDILISRPGPDLDVNFWSRWINSDRGKAQVLAVQGGLAQQHFNVGDLQKLLISLPCLSEQTEVAKRIEAAGARLEEEMDARNVLSSLKSGLMDDLLTGRVRVTPLLEAAAT